MGCEFYLILALVVGALFGLPAWTLTWTWRQARAVRALTERLDELQLDLGTLARRLADDAEPAAPRGAAGEAPPARPPAPGAPSSETPAAPAPAPSPTAPAPAPQRPATAPAPRPPASPPQRPPSLAAAAPTAPAPPARGIDWEQWLGLRGAAVVGAVVLALAGILFLKFSIEHGWISPALRVAMGLAVGAGALAGSESLRKRGYRPTADGLAGAGVVILYASCWAAHTLYGLLGALPAFALMSLVTLTAGLLAWRRRAVVIATLGLAGGFLTPLLLGTHAEHPLGLFGYLLLLDGGLLVLARRRGWPALAVIALVATALYELRWLAVEMDAGLAVTGLAIVAGFGALFAAAGLRGEPDWRWSRAAGLLLPALFALFFAFRADLGPHLWPAAVMLALIGLAASWLGESARDDDTAPTLAVATAVAAGTVVAVWALRTGFAPARAWELTAIALGLAAAFRLPVEVMRRRAGGDLARAPAAGIDGNGAGGTHGDLGRPNAAAEPRGAGDAVAAVGLLALLAVAPAVASSVAPNEPAAPLVAWLTGWIGLAALLWRQAAEPGRSALHSAAALGPAIGLGAAFAARETPRDPLLLAIGVGMAAAVAGLALLRHRRGLRAPAETAALLAPLVLLAALLSEVGMSTLGPRVFAGTSLLLALLALLAATRLPSGAGYAVTGALLAGVHLAWTLDLRSGLNADLRSGLNADLRSDDLTAPAVLAGLAAGGALLTLWAPLAGRALRDHKAAWIAAALAQPVWFVALHRTWDALWGREAIALLPLAQGALALAASFAARRLWPAGSAPRRSVLAWFGAVALGFAALAVPLQLDREWITVAWALEGAAVLALWRRLRHPGLRLFGLALLAVVVARLVANPMLLLYHEASGRFLWSWLTYTYLVPAAALLVAARLLRRQAALGGESGGGRWAVGRSPVDLHAAAACGLAAVAVVFVWLNLAIFDAFSPPGGPIALSIERQPARDLTMSIAWALYALTLLGLGIARGRGGLRKLGLGFLVLTLCKVFLYDLGELEDLYRVGSLVGLALSLLLVSVVYQRFVRGRERDPVDVEGDERDAGG